MTGTERTLRFLGGEVTDRPPFHPIIMRWAAKYAGIPYRDFCTIPEAKCEAMIKCADDFGLDWVTVMSDPWAEASAFGIDVHYPEDELPLDRGGHPASAFEASKLKHYDPLSNMRCSNRLEEIKIFRKECSGKYFIVGWVEGPVAEYVDLRKASEAASDLLLEPEYTAKTMDIITESALNFITLQLKAGADCIGIGDAFCSQIGPELYYRFAFERQKAMVDHIHRNGGLAKLHICGNTAPILAGMIKTGADIVDVDHLVPSMEPFAELLTHGQVLCGKADPVSVIQDGNKNLIEKIVGKDYNEAKRRCIISGGCEITPGTTIENMVVFRKAADTFRSV